MTSGCGGRQGDGGGNAWSGEPILAGTTLVKLKLGVVGQKWQLLATMAPKGRWPNRNILFNLFGKPAEVAALRQRCSTA